MSDQLERLREQILDARAEGRALAIVGGGSKPFVGRATDGAALRVAGHRGIISYQPTELVLTARAGTPLDELDAALAERGQMLAFEPPRLGAGATLGGTLACNLSGPARPWWGSVRDHVLGIRLLNGYGEPLRFGGQVMKNVAGYDLSRLMAGALGTLGVITEVSLKVLPRPACQLTLVQEMEASRAIRLMNQRAGEPQPISAACWLDGRLYTRLSGAHAAVEACAACWPGERLEADSRFWRELREQQHGFFAGEAPLWRFSVSPAAALPDYAADWLLDWGGAQRWLRGDGELAAFEALAAQMGGQVSLFRGGDRHGEVYHHQPAALQQIQQRLKQSFDPDGILNPGRLYGWL